MALLKHSSRSGDPNTRRASTSSKPRNAPPATPAAAIRDQVVFSDEGLAPATSKIPDPSRTGWSRTGWQKAILREAVADPVLESVPRASKRGFGFGIHEEDVLKGPWRERAGDVLSCADSVDGLFCAEKVRALWDRVLGGGCRADLVAKVFAVQVWMREMKLARSIR